MDEKGREKVEKTRDQYRSSHITLILVRPAPQLEIPASDDESGEPPSPTVKRGRFRESNHVSPELGDDGGDDEPFQDDKEPSDLEAPRADADKNITSNPTLAEKPTQHGRKAKGGYKIGKQVSGNFVSYKIRSKGQRGRGRFGGRRPGRC